MWFLRDAYFNPSALGLPFIGYTTTIFFYAFLEQSDVSFWLFNCGWRIKHPQCDFDDVFCYSIYYTHVNFRIIHSFIPLLSERYFFFCGCALWLALSCFFFFFGCLKRLFWARWLKTIWYASLTMSLSCWWKLRVKKRQSTISTAWLIADRRIVCSTFSVSLNCQICFICCWLLLLVLLLEHLPLQYSIWKYSMQQQKSLVWVSNSQ